jgi:hypothetical protein
VNERALAEISLAPLDPLFHEEGSSPKERKNGIADGCDAARWFSQESGEPRPD